jgi:hypothetical protein
MTIPLKMIVVVILILLFTLGLKLGLSNLIIPAVATHAGPLWYFQIKFFELQLSWN